MSAQEILKLLLTFAGYYWYEDHGSQIEPIDLNRYDPAVDTIFKANAHVLEKLYNEIESSQNEVIKSLANVLVPDKYSLPEPGYTVAHLNPRFSRIHLDPDDSFVISGLDDTGENFEFFFTPLFQHSYPSVHLHYLLCEDQLWEYQNAKPKRKQIKPTSAKETDAIWMGLDIGKFEEGDQISFYLGNQVVEEFDKDFSLFHLGRWCIHGDPDFPLEVKRGLEQFNFHEDPQHRRRLHDVLDIHDSYEKRIVHRFSNSFITLSIPPKQGNNQGSHFDTYLDQLKQLKKAPPGFEELEKLQKPLLWIKVEFDLGISYDFFNMRSIYPNAIPLINRKLIERNVSQSSYDRMLLPMPTRTHFLSVNRIWDDTGNQEDYRAVDYLSPNSTPASYLVRRGERVRRLNTKDAQAQISSLLHLIYEEVGTFKESGENRLAEEFQTIDQALARIKLRLDRLELNDWNKTDYFAIANLRQDASIIYYSYWECQGSAVQNLQNRTNLELRSNDKQIEDSFTLIPIQSGEDEKSEDDYLTYLRSTLLSRNKIVTRGDIEMYCHNKYGHMLSELDISQEIMPMMQEPATKERVIAVNLSLSRDLNRSDQEFLKNHLQNELNAMSAFFTPIYVRIAQA